jgi:hypothetical protein
VIIDAQNRVDHRGDPVRMARDASALEGGVEASFQPLGEGIGPLVDGLRGDEVQRRDAGHCSGWVGVEGAALPDAPAVIPGGVTTERHHVHNLRLARHGGARHPPSNNFAKGREVGGDPVAHLRSPRGHAEAGDHFIKDQQHAVLFGQLAEGGEKGVTVQREAAVVGAGGLQNDRRDLCIGSEHLFHRAEVWRQDNHQVQHRLRDSRG